MDDVLAAKKSTVPWVGVRNYQARNFMRDSMQVGDGVLFYHSSCQQPGIVGIAQVAAAAYLDPLQFDPNSPCQDAKSKPEEPRWLLVELNSRLAATSMRKNHSPHEPKLRHRYFALRKQPEADW